MTIPIGDIQDIVRRHMGPMDLAIGRIVQHPTDGRVKILHGCYFDSLYGRLSNHWYWTCVNDKDEPVGKIKNGYGWT